MRVNGNCNVFESREGEKEVEEEKCFATCRNRRGFEGYLRKLISYLMEIVIILICITFQKFNIHYRYV